MAVPLHCRWVSAIGKRARRLVYCSWFRYSNNISGYIKIPLGLLGAHKKKNTLYLRGTHRIVLWLRQKATATPISSNFKKPISQWTVPRGLTDCTASLTGAPRRTEFHCSLWDPSPIRTPLFTGYPCCRLHTKSPPFPESPKTLQHCHSWG